MSIPTTPPAQPGWFADPAGSQLNRWWDGSRWTDNVQAPYQVGGIIERAPEGTSPSTVQIWLIVGLFALQQVAALYYLATIDLAGIFVAYSNAMRDASDPTSVLAIYGYVFTPGYVALLLLSLVSYAATIVLAYFDSKTLASRGVVKPFHWALTFVPSYGSIIYVIGRSVVARRRTGSGLAPLWAYIVVFVVGFIASFVVSLAAAGSMMDDFSRMGG